MIVKNKTEVYVKHIGRIFSPGESKVIPDIEVYEHKDFEIIKKKKIKKTKKKREVKNDSTHKNIN